MKEKKASNIMWCFSIYQMEVINFTLSRHIKLGIIFNQANRGQNVCRIATVNVMGRSAAAVMEAVAVQETGGYQTSSP